MRIKRVERQIREVSEFLVTAINDLNKCIHASKGEQELTIVRSQMDSLQFDIGVWALKTFPKATRESWIVHLIREAKELGKSHKPVEAADCAILLFGYAHKCGFSLLDEAIKKFEIDRGREWKEPDEEGVIEHIEEKPPEGVCPICLRWRDGAGNCWCRGNNIGYAGKGKWEPQPEKPDERTIPVVGPQDIADSVMELADRNKPNEPEEMERYVKCPKCKRHEGVMMRCARCGYQWDMSDEILQLRAKVENQEDCFTQTVEAMNQEIEQLTSKKVLRLQADYASLFEQFQDIGCNFIAATEEITKLKAKLELVEIKDLSEYTKENRERIRRGCAQEGTVDRESFVESKKRSGWCKIHQMRITEEHLWRHGTCEVLWDDEQSHEPDVCATCGSTRKPEWFRCMLQCQDCGEDFETPQEPDERPTMAVHSLAMYISNIRNCLNTAGTDTAVLDIVQNEIERLQGKIVRTEGLAKSRKTQIESLMDDVLELGGEGLRRVSVIKQLKSGNKQLEAAIEAAEIEKEASDGSRAHEYEREIIQLKASNAERDEMYNNLCTNCWEALGIADSSDNTLVWHISELRRTNAKLMAETGETGRERTDERREHNKAMADLMSSTDAKVEEATRVVEKLEEEVAMHKEALHNAIHGPGSGGGISTSAGPNDEELIKHKEVTRRVRSLLNSANGDDDRSTWDVQTICKHLLCCLEPVQKKAAKEDTEENSDDAKPSDIL